MTTLYFESELYHHGVKGMKWGVRRYQNPDGTLTAKGKERLEKYQMKESNAIVKRRLKEVDRDNRRIERKRNKLEETSFKYGRDSRRAKTAFNKYITTKAEAVYRDEVAKAELAKVLNMTLDDVSKERRAVGAMHVSNVLRGIGSATVSTFTGLPVVVPYSNTRNTKTNLRVSKSERDDIKFRAYTGA